jgi:hypothetical protein
MADGMNRDFAEMLDALSAAGADFLIVGAHALAAHGGRAPPEIWISGSGRLRTMLSGFGIPSPLSP